MKQKTSLKDIWRASVTGKRMMRLKLAILALSLAALPISTPAFADKAMLVFDASGSMNAQINGKTKLQIAREVVNGLVQEWPQATDLGLIAYGHREKDNCSDIQTLVKPASDSWPAIKAAVGDVAAKGKTPITEAIRAAARELNSEEGKATVILVSDGLETCNADPCAAAAELKKSGVDFTVHVVGFGTTAEENRQLSCIADTTGGRFLGASNAAELKTAMTKTVQLVAQPEPSPKKTEANKVVVKLQIGWLRLDNSVDGADIYGKDSQKVGSVCTGCGEQQLPVGIYRVKADGFDVETEIKSGEHRVIDVAAFAGWLLLENSSDGGDVYDKGGLRIDSICTGCGQKQLSPGFYRVKADGIDVEVEIKAGKHQILDAANYAGWLLLDNSADGGDIYNKTGQRIDSICTGCGQKQLFPGIYRVKADGIDVEVDIKAGKRQIINAATHAGWLILHDSVKGGVDISDHDGNKIDRACAGCGKKQLAPGKYNIKGEGFQTEIEIKAGQDSVLEVGG